MADVQRQSFWAKEAPEPQGMLGPNMSTRVGLIRGLQYLSTYFQIIVLNREKDFADKIKNYLTACNVVVDAIYSTQCADIAEDFS